MKFIYFKISSFLLLLLIFSTSIVAQNVNEKFGEVTKRDLEIKICPIDSNAHAYYVFDKGDVYFQYIGDNFKMIFTRQLRLKILDNNALDEADFVIQLYTPNGSNTEMLSSIKAVSYNLEGEKIIETKLSKKDIIEEKSSKNYTTKKFAVPNVKAGSIIEVEYTIQSDYIFNLKTWYFQHNIPTLKSQYITQVPIFIKFNTNSIGYHRIFSAYEEGRNTSWEYIAQKFLAENIPAYPDEAYQRTKNGFISRVEFELSYYKETSFNNKNFTTSWDDVDKKLLEDESFGLQLKNNSHHKPTAMKIKNSGAAGVAILSAALDHIKNTMVWNEETSKYTSANLGKTYKEGTGNSADINLNLLTLIRLLEIEAYPIIISTQGNGIIFPTHPTMSSFNYVAVLANIDGVDYLLDATSKYSTPNLLPIRCLNDRARIVSTTRHDWINLMDTKTFSAISQYEYTFDENFTAKATVRNQLKDYAAYLYRFDIATPDNLDEFKEDLKGEYKVSTIDSLKVEGFNNYDDKLTFSFQYTADNLVQQAGDAVYFAPNFDPFISSNPFNLEKREFPVEYDYPMNITQLYTINLPQNYEVTEVPKPLIIRLPENKGSFTFQASNFGSKLSLTVKFVLTKSTYSSEEYFALKELYTKIVEKQKEFVVVKKKQL